MSRATEKALLLEELWRWRYNRQNYLPYSLDVTTLDKAIAWIDASPPVVSTHPVCPPHSPQSHVPTDMLAALAAEIGEINDRSLWLEAESAKLKRDAQQLRRVMAVRGVVL
jgi:hypothetical protein